MKHFLTVGGTIFFVVYISPNGEESKIYFSTFTPVKINALLDKFGKQDSKEIEFNPFPSDGNRKATIFMNFHGDCIKQTSFPSDKMLDDLEKCKDLSGITISVTGLGKDRLHPIKF